MKELATDLLVVLPVSIVVLIFLATVGAIRNDRR